MKKIIILLLAAAALVGAALWLKGGRSQKTPNVVGHKILPAFNISDVTRVEITGAKSLTLASGEAGWTVDALHGYPADGKKILDELLKLKELKAGQPAAGISNAAPTVVILKDAAGKELAKLEMGEQHARRDGPVRRRRLPRRTLRGVRGHDRGRERRARRL